MELTKNQKIVGISLGGVVAYLLFRKKVKLQSHRAETPAGPVQVVVPVPTAAGSGAIANVLGNVLPTAHTDLVGKALGQIPLVIQGGKMAPTRISTVADMQHALTFLKICGNQPLKDSGVLDAPTIACIKAFQTVMQIPVTGLDDPTTKMALESAITKAGISTVATTILSHPSVVSPPVINPKITTERDLQRGLNVLGASPKLKEDGVIGKVTIAAIKAFQVVYGLVADGSAGPQTKAVIQVAMQTPPAVPAAHGDFGWISPPAPPYQHAGAPGYVGGPGYYGGYRGKPPPPPPPGAGVRPGMPYSPQSGGQPGEVGHPGDPAYMRSWERWQAVHPGTPRSDYNNWCTQYGMMPGAAINGDFGSDFGYGHTWDTPQGVPGGYQGGRREERHDERRPGEDHFLYAARQMRRPDAPQPGVGQPGNSAYMRSWERWQVVHPGTPRRDYDNWCTQYGMLPGASINGEMDEGLANSGVFFGYAGGMRGRPARPQLRGRDHDRDRFALGLPVEDEVVVVDDGGDSADFTGEEIRELEHRAHHHAHHEHHMAHLHGDRRFERDGGPVPPPLMGEHRRDEGRVEYRGWGDRLRGWLGWGHRSEEILANSGVPQPLQDPNANPYIPPPATPQMVNWDPFATVEMAPAVDRWNDDDRRRHEELRDRGFAREDGRVDAHPIDHASPPGLPAPVAGRPAITALPVPVTGHPAGPGAPRH